MRFGVWTKKSRRCARPSASRTIRKPPPRREARTGSATQAASAPAITASTTLPPGAEGMGGGVSGDLVASGDCEFGHEAGYGD